MKKFLIVRVAKYKSNSGIAGEIKHNNRELDPTADNKHIDLSKSHLNVHTGITNQQELFDKLKERISTTTRKARPDANKIMEYVYSASPEWMETQTPEQLKAFFEKGLEYLKQKHGEENVLGSWTHYDESSPHMHVFVVPLVKEMKLDKKKNIEVEDIRLNTKHYMNGKVGCSILQTDIYNACGVPFGLDRGIEKSGVKHVAQQVWREENLKKELDQATQTRIDLETSKSKYDGLVATNENLIIRNKKKEADLAKSAEVLKARRESINKTSAVIKKVFEASKEFRELVKKPELSNIIQQINDKPELIDFVNRVIAKPELVAAFNTLHDTQELDYTQPEQVMVNKPATCGQVLNEFYFGSDETNNDKQIDDGFSWV